MPEPLAAPRFVGAEEMLPAGLSAHYNSGMIKGITERWMRFVPHIGRISKQVGCLAFGVAYNAKETPFSMHYMCGVEVVSAEGLPPEFTTLQLSADWYAIFPHLGHVSTISQTVDTIFHSWLSISPTRTIPLRRITFPPRALQREFRLVLRRHRNLGSH